MPHAPESIRPGKIERAIMRSFVRRWVQNRLEFKPFLKLMQDNSIDITGKVLMDAGCGPGLGTEMLVQHFQPSQMLAFDIMPEQITVAERRGLEALFFVGDMTALNIAARSCDAVFIFCVLNTIPQWRQGIKEMARVLKDGGVLLMGEPNRRFSWATFEKTLAGEKLEVLGVDRALFDKYRSYLCRKS